MSDRGGPPTPRSHRGEPRRRHLRGRRRSRTRTPVGRKAAQNTGRWPDPSGSGPRPRFVVVIQSALTRPQRMDTVSRAMTQDDDRRDSLRVPIELKVEYKKLNTFFADYTKNICKGGTFIRTKKPLEIGTIFVFRLTVPKLKEAIAIRGEVKWVKREGEPSPPGVAEVHEPGMGIRFIYETPGERAGLEGAVEKMMIDSLGQLLYSKLMGKDR